MKNPNSDKIVILIGQFARGGSERQAYLLARELRQRHGLDVETWSLFYRGEYSKEFEAAGVPTRVLDFRRPQCPVRLVRAWLWGRRLLSVAHQLRKSRVAVLLPFTAWPNVIAGLAYRLARVRLCIWEERAAGAVRVQPERIAARQYRRFVANSTAGVDFLVNEMRTPRDRITLIPNGVEEPKLEHATDWRARLGLKLSQPLVLKVADVTRDRDHATLLRAWKIVQNSWPGGERPILALAGTLGDAYPEARRISREAGVESTIQFLGGVHEIGALIQASDLAVFSSRSEGMPNGVLECMAAGKAVIASDLPGIRDALGANADEVLASPGDPDRFAHLLMTLLRDKEKRDALGEANRARVLAEFTVDRMVERHLRLIQENLPKASRRAITITAGKDTPNAKQTAPAGRL